MPDLIYKIRQVNLTYVVKKTSSVQQLVNKIRQVNIIYVVKKTSSVQQLVNLVKQSFNISFAARSI